MNIYYADVRPLSREFLRAYPASQYPELMHKQGRPYSCLLIDIHADYYICIPFRSHIHHRNSYMFRGTQRSKRSQSGLDYSKIVIIHNPDYIDSATAVVDQDEYREMQQNLTRIVREAVQYVDGYIGHMTGKEVLRPRDYARRYQYSTLRYFHDVLGISREG